LPPLGKNDRSESLERNTDEIMCQIAALLPENYRGFYSDHPRLQEIIRNKADLTINISKLDTPQTSGIIPNNSIQ
jgi:hypothetical protein